MLMKNIRNILVTAILILALAMPMPAMSQNRQNNGERNRTERHQQRPATSRPGRPQPSQRPGNNRPGRPQQPQRPSDNRPQRPQQPPHHPGNNRPQRPQQPPHRPGNNHPGRPQQPPHRPPHRPSHPHNWSRPMPPPHHRHRVPRPMPPRPITPPHGYHPYVGAPALRSILGITFGTLYASALDYLFFNNYTIDGYADNTIYLSDVVLLNQSWPFATLYCNSAGRLASAQFAYYSSYNSLSRYNHIYNLLCSSYGMPLSLTTSGIARQVMWYGGGGSGYITLEFDYYDGCYHTVLSVST